MASILRLSSHLISAALSETTRQYLVGNLGRPQELDHVHDQRLEVGLTRYTDAGDELPHWHPEATEYQFMISGWTRYLDTETGEEHDFFAGDFYAILPGTHYAQKSKPGTEILFIKVPSINDKTAVDVTPEVETWLTTPLRTVRTDHWHDPAAPKANSLCPAVAVAVLDSSDRLLMLRRADSGNWTLPGGTLEMDESLPACAIREVREEAGLDVEIADIVGTYSDPDARVAYTDGEVRREFTIVLLGRTNDVPVQLDDESTAHSWTTLGEIDTLPMAESQRRRIQDVIDFLASGRRNVS